MSSLSLVFVFSLLPAAEAKEPAPKENPYQQYVENFDEAARAWKSVSVSQRRVLLTCGVTNGTNVSGQRAALLDRYLKQLGPQDNDKSTGQSPVDGVLFREHALKAGQLQMEEFISGGTDACQGGLVALATQVKARVYDLQQEKKALNRVRELQPKQPLLDARFEERHKQISIQAKGPFGVQNGLSCGHEYNKMLWALGGHHGRVKEAIRAFNAKLDQDIKGLVSYMTEIQEKINNCGAAEPGPKSGS